MKKIFSILVVAFFLAASFVLVPQNNYLAFAENEDQQNAQEDDAQEASTVDNEKGEAILEGRTTQKEQTSRCFSAYCKMSLDCGGCQSDGTCKSTCSSTETCQVVPGVQGIPGVHGSICVPRSCRSNNDCKKVCGDGGICSRFRCGPGCRYPYKCNSSTGQCYL